MRNDTELHVAPPRACNTQLLPGQRATFPPPDATENETVDIKALANKRLGFIRSNKLCNTPATEAPKPMQLSPSNEPPKVARVAAPVAPAIDTGTDNPGIAQEALESSGQGPVSRIEWITEQCPLVSDDRAFVACRLAKLALHEQELAARRYVRAWQQAAAAEPHPVRQENAGRFAANQTLVRVTDRPLPSAGGGMAQRQSAVSLAPGERMAWHLHIDGKAVTMAGKPTTREQALKSAQARWPGATVEIVE